MVLISLLCLISILSWSFLKCILYVGLRLNPFRSFGNAATKRPYLIVFSLPLPETVIDEERGEDRTRHHDDRLLAGRLDREQEKVIR